MPRTYEGILRGNRIDWTKDRPSSNKSVRVHVTLVEEESDDTGRGRRMAAALEKLAHRGGIATISNPESWQRQTRNDRHLPGRED
jgi:hypothetical protein